MVMIVFMIMIMVIVLSSWETSPKVSGRCCFLRRLDRNIALALAPPPAEEVAGPVT